MANELLNPTIITKEAVVAFRDSLVLMKNVNEEHSSEFKKIGDTLTIRQPVYFEAVDGETLGTVQDAVEGSRQLVLNKRKHVPMSFTTQDLTLTIEEFSERYIKPAMRELAQKVDLDIAGTYKGMFNFVGSVGTRPSDGDDVGDVNDLLDELGVPDMGMRMMHYEPRAMSAIAKSLQAVFPASIATKAIEKAAVGNFMNLELFRATTLPVHTSGVATGTPLVNGADQDVTYSASKDSGTQSLITDGWTADTGGILREGDVFTLAGVNSVHRATRVDTGQLQTFVVRADAAAGSTTGPSVLLISPPIIISGAYQTVTAVPADDAVITVKTGTAGTKAKQNLGWHKNAITVSIAPLDTNTPGAESAGASEEGVSLRTTAQYAIGTDEVTYRIDILYGVKLQNEGFAIRQTS